MSEPITDINDETEEILALGRMISFACQRAQSMNLEFSTYCLEMALTSLVQDMKNAGVAASPADWPPAGVAPRGMH